MAIYTITTAAAQDAGLTYAVEAANTLLLAVPPVLDAQGKAIPAVLWTADAYLRTRVGEILDSYAAQNKRTAADALMQAVEALPDATKVEIEAFVRSKLPAS